MGEKTIGKAKAEEEFSFIVSPDKVGIVLDAIWPTIEFMNVDGVTFSRASTVLSRTVHFFLEREKPDVKDRIKLYWNGKKVCVELSRKDYSGGLKTEKVIHVETGKKDGVRFLNQQRSIIGCLVKERATLSYKLGIKKTKEKTVKLKVGVDRVIFINLHDFEPVSAVYHVEFEGDGHDSEKMFCESAFFAERVAPHITPLNLQSGKLQVARELSGGPVEKRWASYSELKSFYAAAIGFLDDREFGAFDARKAELARFI